MGTVVLDASVVLALMDATDTTHRASVTAVRKARTDGGRLVLPASAFSEVLVGSVRQGPEVLAFAQGFVDDVIDSIAVVDREVAVVAATLRAERASLRLPDALVIGTALVHDARVLTCDRALGRVDDCVTVVA